MPRIENYRIVEGMIEDVETEVFDLLINGWQPIGGVSLYIDDESPMPVVMQAMVKFT